MPAFTSCFIWGTERMKLMVLEAREFRWLRKWSCGRNLNLNHSARENHSGDRYSASVTPGDCNYAIDINA